MKKLVRIVGVIGGLRSTGRQVVAPTSPIPRPRRKKPRSIPVVAFYNPDPDPDPTMTAIPPNIFFATPPPVMYIIKEP